MTGIPEHVRSYIYSVLLALLPILTAYGVISEQEAPLYVGLAAAILGVGLATANTPRKPKPPQTPPS